MNVTQAPVMYLRPVPINQEPTSVPVMWVILEMDLIVLVCEPLIA